MSKRANAGELRTPVRFMRIEGAEDKDGYSAESEKNVFGDGKPEKHVMCKWVNSYGAEAWQNATLNLREPATLTTRYSPKLDDPTLICYKGKDPVPFEVVATNNVLDRCEWLEIKVQRRVKARAVNKNDD